jgi:tRNA pseudouridine32 synthase / 23S rRNA pseudouridine746 synthase
VAGAAGHGKRRVLASGMSRPSTVHLPPGAWATVLDALSARFPAVSRAQWSDRMERGRVLDGDGRAIPPDAPYRAGLRVHYFREVAAERPIPFAEEILHVDEDLVVADKPPFLPVMPGGDAVDETLHARLVKRLGNPDLVALHRLDRATAGVVLFSASPRSRAAYHALFRERRIEKRYQCLAPALPGVALPLTRATRLVPGEPFFRMREVDGPANSETRIEVLDGDGEVWRYRLHPVTGRKHQLRVHMAGLGAPILHDRYYPVLTDRRPDDPDRPLALLADRIAFIDPVTGSPRSFASHRLLDAGAAGYKAIP